MLTAETRQEIERRALEITAELDAKLGPYHAEIVPCAPLWHIVTTKPAGEALALDYLSQRGFGVYVPSFETIKVVRGRKVPTYKTLFPGHVFLFVWDVIRHWRRVMACPGVANILTINERPVVVPFEAIYRMQAIEFTGIEEPKRPRRRRRRGHVVAVEEPAHRITVSCKSYWAGIQGLDGDGRNHLLHVALGLT